MKPIAAKTVSLQPFFRNCMPKMATYLFALLFAVAATCAQATTYYWKPGATQGLWTDLSNWSTTAIDGADASALPGSSDSLNNAGHYNFDLGGETRTLATWPEPEDYTHYTMTLANGTLKFTGGVRRYSGEININSGATLFMPLGSTLYTGVYTDTQMPINVNNGGAMTVEGTVRFYNTVYNVYDGGTLTFAPSTMRVSAESHNYSDGINNAGTLLLPNGFTMNTFDAASATAGASFTISQTAGTMNLGGPITINNQPGVLNVVFSGGTVNVTGDVTFNVTSATVTNSVEFKVASGKTLNLTPVTFAADSSITKTGDGSVVLPTTGATATISAGSVTLNAATYDFSGVTFGIGTGATINLASLGGRIDSADSSIANATFAATIPASAGTAVFYSTDSTLLAKVKADLDASVPEGFDLVVDGEELSVEAETSASFTVTGDVTAAAGWGGVVPAAGSDVAIDGAGVVATLPSSGVLPAWNSIEVKNGATLRIEADATLPAIILNKNATLEIGGNATVTMSDLTGAVATSPSLVVPSLAVESGATLNVPGGMKFSNVNISLSGKIAVTSAGTLTIGYAAAGDSTYIGFISDGGAITLFHGGNYDVSRLGICCPEVGGTVHVVGEKIYFQNMPTVGTHFHEIHYSGGFHVGVGNPANESFEVVFSNTKWGTNGNLYVGGGATFRLQDNSSFVNSEEYGYYNRHVNVTEAGKIIIGNGSELRVNALGNYGSISSTISADISGHKSIVVEDGGTYENYCTTGNGNADYEFSNGVYRVYLPNIAESGYNNTNRLFEGAHAVFVDADSVLTFSTRNGTRFTDGSGDRVVALADVPITGGGSVALSNANVNVFGVIVKSGANTASGTASVVDPEAGIGATTLYFADGANWAGTVVAGNVALTNLTAGAVAANVDFGTLDLAVDFPIRVWKDNGGSIVTNDMLNVGTYDNTNGGQLVPISAASGEPLAAEGKIVVGKIAKGSPLPAVVDGWSASASDILGDDANNLLTLKPKSGVLIIVK